MVGPYLNQVGGNVDNDASTFAGGLNTYVDKAFLEASQMPYTMNMELGSAPGIKTRTPRTTLAHYMDGYKWEHNIGEIMDIFAYDQYQVFVVAKKENEVHVYKMYRPYSFGYRAPHFIVKDMGTIDEETCYYFTIARQATNNWVYITGLGFKSKIQVMDDPLNTGLTPVPDGKYGICCCHKGRMFLANPGTNRIVFSALGDFDNFDTPIQYQVVTNPLDMADHNIVYLVQDQNANNLWDKYVWDEAQSSFVQSGTIAKTELIIDTTTGLSLPDYSIIAGEFQVTNAIGKIVSIKSFDDKLVIFCEHSIHLLYGDTPDVSMQNQFQLVDLNNNLGAIADRCIAIGGGRLFFLGDNQEVYEYTGSELYIISRPGKTRNSTLALGGISGVIDAADWDQWSSLPVDYGYSHSKFAATSEKLFINIWNAMRTGQKLLFVFDIYNRSWWCEDGDFNTICDFSKNENRILIGLNNGDILMNNFNSLSHTWDKPGGDRVYNFGTESIETKDIEYEFHTRVYGADGTDLRESLAKIWLQCGADADVYINDIWTSTDVWSSPTEVHSNLIKIGELEWKNMLPTQDRHYRPEHYEQQVCYVEKMYGQRLNTFQIIVKGKGHSTFYVMKREWRAR